MERAAPEALWLSCPDLADVLVGSEAAQRLEPAGKVVGGQEVAEMAAHLLLRVIIRAPDDCTLEDAVHALDLSVRPGMARFGQAMIDAVLGISQFEGVGAEDLAPRLPA
jgi:hypothetical protein